MANQLEDIKVGDKLVKKSYNSYGYNSLAICRFVEVSRITPTLVVLQDGTSIRKKTGRVVGSDSYAQPWRLATPEDYEDDQKSRMTRSLIQELEAEISRNKNLGSFSEKKLRALIDAYRTT